jgi:Cupin domain
MTGMLRLEDSGGVLALDDCEVPAGWEGAAADHGAADHGYYVIGGELTVRLGDEIANVRTGGFVFAPRGVPHSVANAGDAPARYVLIETPVQEAGPDLGPKLVEDVPGRVRVLLRGADSAGRIAVMDNVVPAGAKGPPLHHHDFDEAFTCSRARRPSSSATPWSLAGAVSSSGRRAARTTRSRTRAGPTSAGS